MKIQDKNKKYSIDLTSFVPVDSEQAWEKVNARLSAPKPIKKPFLLLRRLVAASIIIAIVGTATYLLVPQKSKESHQSYIIDMPIISAPNESAIITTDRGEKIEVKNNHTVIAKNGAASMAENRIYESLVPIMITIEVPHGKIHKLTLPDGSIVTLNAHSKLTFPSKFDGKSRDVKLEGEAFFEVEKSTIPFTVDYSYNRVRVLGTKFNISAYPNSETFATTLISGSVEMSTFYDSGTTTQILQPSEQYSYNITKDKVDIYCVDTEYVSSWMENKFEFRNMYLYEIVEQMERWYKINVRFVDEQMKYIKFSGTAFKDKDANDLFKVLEQIANIKFQYTRDNTIIITN